MGNSVYCKIDEKGVVTLGNAKIKLVFVRDDTGKYMEYQIYTLGDSKEFLVGVCRPFGRVTYRSDECIDYTVRITPDSVKLGEPSKAKELAKATFAGKFIDVDGVEWISTFAFSLEPGKAYVDAEQTLKAEKLRHLVAFHGITIYAGENSFGTKKDAAVFPGLEYLVQDEVSSSERDFALQIRLRHVPHPYKVTVPLMAVTYGGHLIGLTWDPLYRWDGEHMYTSARFASPNWLEKDPRRNYTPQNHLLGLFLPSVPDWVQENDDRGLAPARGHSPAYQMMPGCLLTIRSQIIADYPSDIPKAIHHVISIRGLADLPPKPRDYDEELDLCIDAYTKTLWDPEKEGWHATSSMEPPAPDPYICNHLWIYSLLTEDEEKKSNIRDIVLKVKPKLKESFSGGIPFFPYLSLCFHTGSLDAALEDARKLALKHLEMQGPDGSWKFKHEPHFDETHKQLGDEEDTNIGACASHVIALLKYAKITGDQRFLNEGLKGLKFMDKFEKPAGAQTWEIPLHAPDINASALPVYAYIEAYKITKDEHYLKKAVEWGYKGIPFIYLWNAPDRPIMRYGSIPIFGATWFMHPWVGNLVQWCGMVYGHSLLRLADLDKSLPWAKIAEGITISGMQQQADKGRFKGLFTDIYGVVSGSMAYSWWLNPVCILRNLYSLLGYDEEPYTEVFGNPRIHLTSAAKIIAPKTDTSQNTVDFKLEYFKGETNYTLIAGKKTAPSKILKDGKEIAPTKNLDKTEEGWMHNSETGFTIIKVKHKVPEASIQVRYKP